MNALHHVPRAPGGRFRLLLGVAFAVTLAAAAAMVARPDAAHAATQICSNQTGNNGGNYYQMWSNGQGSACITLNSNSSYSTSWSGIGDFVAGVGWNPGSNNAVTYNGSLNASGGTALLSLYGWSTNPLVEFYVIEDYVGSPPTQGTNMGTMTSDGSTYTIIEHQQVNQPCITGNSCTFEQYIAIRQSRRSSGTITFSNFVSAWASHGMNLGTRNYEIMATEAWGGGSGSSSATLGSAPPTTAPPTTGGPTTAPPPTSAPPTNPGGSGCRAAYSVVSSWNGGFQATVTVTNAGSSTLNGWTVNLNLPSGQGISSLWNGVNSGTSGAVSVKNAAYNGALAAGASTSFGYVGTGDGSQTPSNIGCTSP